MNFPLYSGERVRPPFSLLDHEKAALNLWPGLFLRKPWWKISFSFQTQRGEIIQGVVRGNHLTGKSRGAWETGLSFVLCYASLLPFSMCWGVSDSVLYNVRRWFILYVKRTGTVCIALLRFGNYCRACILRKIFTQIFHLVLFLTNCVWLNFGEVNTFALLDF